MTMEISEFTVRFLTPGFLGNAEQDGQWRTPPFKALLRQWWRIVYAADQGFNVDVAKMREAEGRLFGVAADKAIDSRKSEIRLRLSRWDKGSLASWAGLETQPIAHPDVSRPVGAQLYLGFGPLVASNGTTLKKRAAVQGGETAELQLAYPSEYAASLQVVLGLVNLYGTLGGRSRNGWGSFTLTPLHKTPVLPTVLGDQLFRHWRDALQCDWPHCIGTSGDRPLIWQTEPMGDWKAAMKRLAEIKIGLRTQFTFSAGTTEQPEARHWLSYPVTNHRVGKWKESGKGDYRLPNSLRFKVRQDVEGKLHGIIFHIPCLPPKQFKPDNNAIYDVWQKVHAYLDALPQQLTRIPT
ncbi:MAG: hypothetical protein ACYDCF_04545 [Burkholderiales bacterium]